MIWGTVISHGARLLGNPATWLGACLVVAVVYVQFVHLELDAAEARTAEAIAKAATLSAVIDRQHQERNALIGAVEAQNAALLKMRADADRMRQESLAAVERAKKAASVRRGSMDAKSVEELNQWLHAALR